MKERLFEAHDRVRKQVIRYTKKRVPRFLILEVLHRCFPVNIAKFLRAPILTNICERLLLNNGNSLSCTKYWIPPIIAQYDTQPRHIKRLIVLLRLIVLKAPLIGFFKKFPPAMFPLAVMHRGGGGLVALGGAPPPPPPPPS